METKRILIVEDERALQEAVKAKLESIGFTTVIARSVSEALEALEAHEKIDAIWLDHYLLGKESGLDFVTQLKKEDGDWSSIPVFVVSNTASEDKVQSYLHLGVKNYYVKAEHKLEDIIADVKAAV